MRFFLLLPIAVLCLLPSLPERLTTLTAQEPAEEEGPLAHSMKELKRGLRAMRGLMADPEATVDAVEQLRAMEQAVLEGFAFSPAPFGELSAIELRTWDVRFRRSLLSLADQFCAVELALLEGKYQEAQALYKELGKFKKAGHGIFKAD